MDTTTYYVTWYATRLLALAAGCLFFGLDRINVKREREQEQHTIWYRRGFFVAGWIFFVPLLGVEAPEMIITLVVFHGSVLPSSPDFNFQISKHSLSFFTWLALFSYGADILLIIYVIYLGITEAFRQQKQRKARK